MAAPLAVSIGTALVANHLLKNVGFKSVESLLSKATGKGTLVETGAGIAALVVGIGGRIGVGAILGKGISSAANNYIDEKTTTKIK